MKNHGKNIYAYYMTHLSDAYKKEWEKYRDSELRALTPILATLGFALDDYQPHITGERFLMQAVTTTSGKKLILVGRRVSDGLRVVIKATSDKYGARELIDDRRRKLALNSLPFAYGIFISVPEILFIKVREYIIAISTFIEQSRPFLERPFEKKFRLTLDAFKTQEGAHATTYKHFKLICKIFGSIDARGYLANYKKFEDNIFVALPKRDDMHCALAQGEELLTRGLDDIERYCGFLTHTDFVPHNIRVANGDIYLLDHSSLRFGNKYEGLARFLNFMTLHDRPLENALLFYFKENRSSEEYHALWLMRVYRLSEIIWFYTSLLDKTGGDLHTLTAVRVDFWTCVLEATLKQKIVSDDIVITYQNTRDALRAPDEIERQKGLH